MKDLLSRREALIFAGVGTAAAIALPSILTDIASAIAPLNENSIDVPLAPLQELTQYCQLDSFNAHNAGDKFSTINTVAGVPGIGTIEVDQIFRGRWMAVHDEDDVDNLSTQDRQQQRLPVVVQLIEHYGQEALVDLKKGRNVTPESFKQQKEVFLGEDLPIVYNQVSRLSICGKEWDFLVDVYDRWLALGRDQMAKPIKPYFTTYERSDLDHFWDKYLPYLRVTKIPPRLSVRKSIITKQDFARCEEEGIDLFVFTISTTEEAIDIAKKASRYDTNQRRGNKLMLTVDPPLIQQMAAAYQQR